MQGQWRWTCLILLCSASLLSIGEAQRQSPPGTAGTPTTTESSGGADESASPASIPEPPTQSGGQGSNATAGIGAGDDVEPANAVSTGNTTNRDETDGSGGGLGDVSRDASSAGPVIDADGGAPPTPGSGSERPTPGTGSPASPGQPQPQVPPASADQPGSSEPPEPLSPPESAEPGPLEGPRRPSEPSNPAEARLPPPGGAANDTSQNNEGNGSNSSPAFPPSNVDEGAGGGGADEDGLGERERRPGTEDESLREVRALENAREIVIPMMDDSEPPRDGISDMDSSPPPSESETDPAAADDPGAEDGILSGSSQEESQDVQLNIGTILLIAGSVVFGAFALFLALKLGLSWYRRRQTALAASRLSTGFFMPKYGANGDTIPRPHSKERTPATNGVQLDGSGGAFESGRRGPASYTPMGYSVQPQQYAPYFHQQAQMYTAGQTAYNTQNSYPLPSYGTGTIRSHGQYAPSSTPQDVSRPPADESSLVYQGQGQLGQPQTIENWNETTYRTSERAEDVQASR